ncbi:MAG: menaquinone biosynthesis protein [Desulfobacterota bacterium]|nr:menaquinone biosynthesis protein [Thermodesulfobacteriota bacterium]
MKSGISLESPANQWKVVLVSYLNTYPIVWGLKKISAELSPEVVLAPPAICTQKLLDNETQVALVPSITYLTSSLNFEILPLGIVADREVDTVLLVGNQPLENWKTVFLDPDSLTSVRLTKIIFRQKNLFPKFICGIERIRNLNNNSGALIIGNKCFELAPQFAIAYDLSKLWFDLTQLPFIFALFLARPQTDQSVLKKAYQIIKMAIELGLKNLDQVVDDWIKENPSESERNNRERQYYCEYLKNKISYFLTPETILSLRKFFSHCSEKLAPEKEARLTSEYFLRSFSTT